MCDLHERHYMCLVITFVCCFYPIKHYIMATKISTLEGIPPFEFNTTDILGLANKWKNGKSSFEIYVIASRVTDNKQKRAILLHMGGHQLQKLFQTLPDTGEDTDYDIKQVFRCQEKCA